MSRSGERDIDRHTQDLPDCCKRSRMIRRSIVICTLFICGLNFAFAEIPDYIKVCKREKNTINDCVRNSIEYLRPFLVEGIPELNVPPIEPFYIPQLTIISGDLTPLKASAKDLKVSGTGNFTIKTLTLDLDTLTIKARVRFPKLNIEGRYNLDTLLIVPLRGEGKLTATASKCDADAVVVAKVVKRNGEDYISFTSMDLKIGVKDYRIRLDGLFNGDKTLGDTTNAVINGNKEEFLSTLLPYIEKTVAKILLDAAENISNVAPMKELLPNP